MDVRTRRDVLVRSLRRRDMATVAELVAEVGTSRRTVLRDVAALREEGFVTLNPRPGAGAACASIRARC
jgi:predicted DNA-binding transcriptional regulator YafY